MSYPPYWTKEQETENQIILALGGEAVSVVGVKSGGGAIQLVNVALTSSINKTCATAQMIESRQMAIADTVWVMQKWNCQTPQAGANIALAYATARNDNTYLFVSIVSPTAFSAVETDISQMINSFRFTR